MNMNRNMFQRQIEILTSTNSVFMLWFNFIFGSTFLKPIWFLFPFVSDYDNEYDTMKIKNQTGLKILNQIK